MSRTRNDRGAAKAAPAAKKEAPAKKAAAKKPSKRSTKR